MSGLNSDGILGLSPIAGLTEGSGYDSKHLVY